MKITIYKIVMIVLAAVLALPVMAQFEYEEPNAQFQSTSGMITSGSAYSSTPTLNNDGTAAFNDPTLPADAPEGAMHKARKGGLPGTPGDSGVQQPIGDATLPLMLMAVAFAATVAIRNRRRQVAE